MSEQAQRRVAVLIATTCTTIVLLVIAALGIHLHRVQHEADAALTEIREHRAYIQDRDRGWDLRLRSIETAVGAKD